MAARGKAAYSLSVILIFSPLLTRTKVIAEGVRWSSHCRLCDGLCQSVDIIHAFLGFAHYGRTVNFVGQYTYGNNNSRRKCRFARKCVAVEPDRWSRLASSRGESIPGSDEPQ